MARLRLMTCVGLMGAGWAALCASNELRPSPNDILKQTGVQGGLIVHIGCQDRKRIVALHTSDAYLVHGLGTNEAEVEAARS